MQRNFYNGNKQVLQKLTDNNLKEYIKNNLQYLLLHKFKHIQLTMSFVHFQKLSMA